MVEFLISTMNRHDLNFLGALFPNSILDDQRASFLIINQCSSIDIPHIVNNSYNVRVISVKEIGLSKSRNLALNNAIGDICVISDDDFYYMPNCIDIIISAYERLPQTDVITFQTISNKTKKLRKQYKSSIFQYNLLSLMQVSSSDITFRRERILYHHISFDEKFGLGTPNMAGEDNIFISDCFRSGLNIFGYPEIILATPEETTGFKMLYLPHLRGNILRRIYSNYFIFLVVCFVSSFRHYHDYSFKYSFFRYFIALVIGDSET